MAKINLNRETLSRTIGNIFPFFKSVYRALHASKTFYKTINEKSDMHEPNDYHLTPKQYYNLHGLPNIEGNIAQIVGPFQHILDAFKDLKDTFKPYKNGWQLIRDISSFGKGFINIARGSGNLIVGSICLLSTILGSPLILMFALPTFALASFKSKGNLSEFWIGTKDLAKELLKAASTYLGWTLEGVLSTLRGVTELAAYPLSLFIKSPLRGIITAIKGLTPIQENGFIQDMIRVEYPKAVQENNLEKQRDIMIAIRAKYNQCKLHGDTIAKTHGIHTRDRINSIFKQQDYLSNGFEPLKDTFTGHIANP